MNRYMMNKYSSFGPKVNRKTFDKWAVTLTLKPYLLERYTHVEQYEIVLPQLCDILERYKSHIQHTKLAFELTHDNNIHMHMIMRSSTLLSIKLIRFILDEMFATSTVFGFYFVKPIYDIIHWEDYINKGPYFIEHYKYAF